MRQINLFILNTLFLLFAPLSAAEWMVTPSVGYTLGGKVLIKLAVNMILRTPAATL